MKINDVDIKDKMDILLLKKHIVNSEIVTNEEWADEWISPITENQYYKYTTILCEFLVEDETRVEEVISELIKLGSQAVLEFDDINIKYKGFITGHDKELVFTNSYIVKIEWKCGLGYSDEEIIAVNDEDTIILSSTADTPVVLSIIPDTNISELTIAGFGEDITLSNLVAGYEVIIDGEKGLVTEEGQNKWNDYDSWGFPKLSPGENEISYTGNVNITAIYSPRWL